MPATELLKLEKDGYIAWLTMNRPEKRNAMNLEVLHGFMEMFDQLDRDPEVRVVVLQGAGKSFCAGMELAALAGILGSSTADYRETLRREIVRFQDSMTAVEKCRKPVIAAMHGHCIGGGLDLACACDIRIASRETIFSVRETKLALIADLGTLQRLPLIIGEPWARELALTGRDFTADLAYRIGLITHLCDDQASLHKKAAQLAGDIAANSPLAVMGVKDVMRFSRDNGVKAGLEYVAQKNAAVLICEDGLEAISAHMEKRSPKFKGR